MKQLLFAASLLLISGLTSCTTPPGTAFKGITLDSKSLSSLGQKAIVAAKLGGVVNETQAGAISTGGQLLFKAVNGEEVDAVDLSNAIVDYAEAHGDLTEAEAKALREAGTVPLPPDPAKGPATPPGTD